MGAQDIAKTRLGDLLIERGLITADQLQRAIAQQKACSRQLGEILVANGWVTNRQINQALRRQSKLRNAILTSLLSLSPMVLVGCGSSTGVDSENTVAVEEVVSLSAQSEQNEGSDSVGDEGEDSQNSEDNSNTEIASPPASNDSGNLEEPTSEGGVSVVHVDAGEEESAEESNGVSEDSSDTQSEDSSGSDDESLDAVVEDGVEEGIVEEDTAVDDGVEEGAVVEEDTVVEEPVTAEPGATIQLSWSYPEKRTDGSDLEVFDVQSFRVYQLSEDGELGEMHEVDGLDTQLNIVDLADGEYHFAITVVDTEGNESELSDAISVSVI